MQGLQGMFAELNKAMAEEEGEEGKEPTEEEKKMMADLENMTKNLFGGAGSQGAQPGEANVNEDELMKQMQELMKGTEDNPDIKKAFDSILNEFIGKDVLAEPLRRMHEKFPDYLEKNKDSLSKEDFERYSK